MAKLISEDQNAGSRTNTRKSTGPERPKYNSRREITKRTWISISHFESKHYGDFGFAEQLMFPLAVPTPRRQRLAPTFCLYSTNRFPTKYVV
jgi:hypothetical protein